MIFQPVLHPLLLVLLCAPLLVLCILALRQRGERWVWALRILMLVLLAGMLLRPGVPGGSSQTLATDTDVVLVVDTTASIVAEDWDGDKPRLDGVRADAQAIVDAYPGARFALLTFDANAQLRVPLTTDTTALISSLDVLRPEVTEQSRGSSIGAGASLLTDTLQGVAEAAPDRARMVFYLGDGEQTASQEPESFAGAADYVDAGGVLGYGTADGGPMRTTTGAGDEPGEYIQYQGEDARSVPSPENLNQIASELGVRFQARSAESAPQLPAAPATTIEHGSGTVGNVIELYWILALALVVLLGVEVARATMLLMRLRTAALPSTPDGERRILPVMRTDNRQNPSPNAQGGTK